MPERALNADARDADPVKGGINRSISPPQLVVLRSMTSGGCMHLTQRSRERDETLRCPESITAREQILQGRACPKIFHDENPGLVVGGKKTWRNGTPAHGQELQGRLLVVKLLWFAAGVSRRTADCDDDRTRHQTSIGLYGASCDVGPGGYPVLG
ncbi:MAG: hypothetical protein ACJ8CB_34980 [Ktedonobacteraceae bacterium]